MKTLYLDMDSTVFDYLFEYSKRHFEEIGERIQITDDKLDGRYHIHELFGISERFKYRYLDERFFEEMPFYPNAKEVINDLHKRYKIVFVTHIVTKEAFKGKVNRLEKEFKWFNFEDNLITLKDKHLLEPSLIIDDNPYVLNECFKRGFLVCKYKQKWNENASAHLEVNDWNEIRKWLLV